MVSSEKESCGEAKPKLRGTKWQAKGILFENYNTYMIWKTKVVTDVKSFTITINHSLENDQK